MLEFFIFQLRSNVNYCDIRSLNFRFCDCCQFDSECGVEACEGNIKKNHTTCACACPGSTIYTGTKCECK